MISKVAAVSGMDWVREAATKPAATITFDRDAYSVKELACTLVWSDRLEAESFANPAIRSLIERSLTEAAAAALDARLWQGPDTDEVGPTGVFSQSPAPYATINYGDGGGDLADDIRTALRQVRAANYTPNFIACHSVVLDRLQALQATGGEPKYPTVHSANPSIFGVPIVPSNNLPCDAADNTDGLRSTKILVGDSRQLYVAVMPSTLLISNVATVSGVSMFESDQTALRLTMNCSTPVLRRSTAFCAIEDAMA